MSGIGRIAIRWHRPIEGEVKTLRIGRKIGKGYASFASEMGDKPALLKTGRAVGVDERISSLIATSECKLIENQKWYRRGQAKLRVLQRTVSRRKKGGVNRSKAVHALQTQHEYVANQRKDFLNKLVNQ
ncbi:MAG: transposase [Chloroflexi bacterium]|nr:transposase [Chloroflexota bacterium]